MEGGRGSRAGWPLTFDPPPPGSSCAARASLSGLQRLVVAYRLGWISLSVPGVQRIDRPSRLIASDRVASRFFALNERVVARLAYCLDVAEFEEQHLIALVRSLVVGNRGTGMVPVALDDDAVAALAGVEIAEEGLLPDAVRSPPAGIRVEAAVCLGLR